MYDPGIPGPLSRFHSGGISVRQACDMQLNHLQRQLERLYDVHSLHRVEDFLLPDSAEACSVPPRTPEALLVRQADDALDIGLFLDQELVQRLRLDCPARQLHDGNLEDYLAAVEGVSHFLYLVWNAHHGRCVTQLEMELQAEVDKYVTATYWISRQYGGHALGELHQTLFRKYRLRDGLSLERRERYQRASLLASRYCLSLDQDLRRYRRTLPSLTELRRFYRMSQRSKIRHIQALGA